MDMDTAEFDLLITGGDIIDGTKAPRQRADIGVKDGKIVAIGNLQGRTAARHVDATGKVVAPGFIDAHTHDDQALLLAPQMEFKVSQGVTTVVTGNCGLSAAPLTRGIDVPAPLNLLDDKQARFETFAGYLDELRKQPAALNVIPLVGHSNLRVMTMSDLDREANAQEIAAMQDYLEEALQAGAFGMSAGTYYPPAAAATTHELEQVGAPLRKHQAMYVAHIRNESDRCAEAVQETIDIGRNAQAQVLISHHKLARQPNWGGSVKTLALMEQAMQCQCVSVDCYPYAASSTMLHTEESMLQGKVLIASSEPHPELQGQDLGDIAAMWGVSRAEAAARLQPANAIYFSMSEDDVQRILSFPPTMIGSDGLPSNSRPHPRLWGTFPRVLGHYSRDVGLFPLETAVWKMTGLTAEVFGLADRGTLQLGHCADITIFDPATVQDTATYNDPMQQAAGIDYVFVNGTLAYAHGSYQGSRTGQVLQRKQPPVRSPGMAVAKAA